MPLDPLLLAFSSIYIYTIYMSKPQGLCDFIGKFLLCLHMITDPRFRICSFGRYKILNVPCGNMLGPVLIEYMVNGGESLVVLYSMGTHYCYAREERYLRSITLRYVIERAQIAIERCNSKTT